MQSNIVLKTLPGQAVTTALTSKLAATGQLFQIRNHVKMYPWRFNRSNHECYLDNTRTPYTDKHNINEFRPSKAQRKSWQKTIPKDKDNRFNCYSWNDNFESDPKEAKETASSKLSRFTDSLRTRGPARNRRAYNPPNDVEEKILTISKNLNLKADDVLQDRNLKFQLISSCMEIFKHDMPSSYLNDTNTVQDVIQYFSTPVIGVNPYENLVSRANELPPNLAIIVQPKRYDRENDDFFGGHNALPGIISKVEGLRAAKKYPVLNQDEFQWPDI